MKTRIDQKKEEGLRQAVSGEAAGPTSGDGEVRQRIAVRAYELYQERGGGDGHDLDDWLEAERAILGPQRQCLTSPVGVSCDTRKEDLMRANAPLRLGLASVCC